MLMYQARFLVVARHNAVALHGAHQVLPEHDNLLRKILDSAEQIVLTIAGLGEWVAWRRKVVVTQSQAINLHIILPCSCEKISAPA